MNKKDYYAILEIEKSANADEIKKAYKKLALKYHPDRNPENKKEAEEKFKLISEAYTILSNEDKRRQYDIMGSGEECCDFDFGDDLNDPFSVFNDIFQQHMNQFMNMKYEDDINVGSIFNHLSGGKHSVPFGNVHIRVHTFTNDPTPFQSIHFNNHDFKKRDDHESFYVDSDNEQEEDEDDEDEENNVHPMKNISSMFQNFFGMKEKSKETYRKKSPNIEKKIIYKKIYEKPESIIYNITTNLSDIFESKKKKITIVRKRKKNGKYIEKKKKIEVPLYAKEFILEKEGNQIENYEEKGDVIIQISCKPSKNWIRINDYDLLIKKEIEIYQIYSEFYYDIILPHGQILEIAAEKMIGNNNLLQKINKKGIPYEEEGNIEYGNIFVQYQIRYPNEIENLKKNCDLKKNDKKNDKIEYEKAINCDLKELFLDIL